MLTRETREFNNPHKNRAESFGTGGVPSMSTSAYSTNQTIQNWKNKIVKVDDVDT